MYILTAMFQWLYFFLIIKNHNCSSYPLRKCSWLQGISPVPGNKVWCDRDQHPRAHRTESGLNIFCLVQTRRPRSSRGSEDHPDAEQEDLTVLRDIVQSPSFPSALTSSPSLHCSSDSVLPTSPGDRLPARCLLSMMMTKSSSPAVTFAWLNNSIEISIVIWIFYSHGTIVIEPIEQCYNSWFAFSSSPATLH